MIYSVRRQLHKTKTFSETVGIERLWVQCKGIQHRIGKCSFEEVTDNEKKWVCYTDTGTRLVVI